MEIEENHDSESLRKTHRVQFCWLTGYTGSYKPRWWAGPWWLQLAHISSGSGAMHRVDDRRAVVLLCPLAHDLHVANRHAIPSKKIGGVHYPTIDAGNMLWLKKTFDPKFYDPKYLQSIWTGSLPSACRPDKMWLDMLLNNKGLKL